MKSMTKNEPDAKSGGALSICMAVVCVLLSILLLCNITIIVKGTVNTEKPPSVFGITPMVVLSGSMSGTQEGHIEVGDLIFAKSAEPETLKENDVISFVKDGTAVTHRITSIETDENGNLLFTTKGDANETEDTEKVTEEQIVGTYLARFPKVGDFALFLQQPIGMLLFIGVPLMAFIIYDIIRRQRYAVKENRRTQELEAEIARLREAGGKDTPV